MQCSKDAIVADSIDVNLMWINNKECKLKLDNWLITSTVQTFTCTYFHPFAKKNIPDVRKLVPSLRAKSSTRKLILFWMVMLLLQNSLQIRKS